MSKVIAIITDPAIGGTFLAWSIEYLAGHHSMYNAFSHTCVPVLPNPMVNNNAHLHQMNHFSSKISSHHNVQLLYQVIAELQLNKTNPFHIIYTHMYSFMEHSVDGGNKWDYDAFCEFVNALSNQCITSIFVHVPMDYALYFDQMISRATSKNAMAGSLMNYFPTIDIKSMQVYDKRELIALTLNPHSNEWFSKTKHVVDNDAFLLLSPELWLTLDYSIFNIMRYLNIGVNDARYGKWVEVYGQWKKLHSSRIRWCWYFDEIMDAVLNGHDMDLVRFDLDLLQEATIQHELIYKHNLNLKTFELYKFKNTKQLHNLLEPNIHDLSKSKIYDN